MVHWTKWQVCRLYNYAKTVFGNNFRSTFPFEAEKLRRKRGKENLRAALISAKLKRNKLKKTSLLSFACAVLQTDRWQRGDSRT